MSRHEKAHHYCSTECDSLDQPMRKAVTRRGVTASLGSFPDCKDYLIKGGLDNLIRRLEKGMRLRARIVDCAGENKYLLRIWGYNILTESRRVFQQFDEVQLIVREVTPHLVLDLIKNN